MKFADIIGHEALKEQMRQSIRNGRIPHTQLFAGMSGYGSLPLALAYVQYLNCESRGEQEACGVCPSCVQFSELSHPDLHFVMPVNKQGKKSGENILSRDFLPLWRDSIKASGGYLEPEEWYKALDLGKTLKGAIAAPEADEIIKQLSFKSYSGGYKIMIIWLPEMMHETAANKLLKILEEPWDKTIFILVSQSPEQLLPTIISRTQIIEVPRIEPAALEAYATSKSGESDPSKLHSMAHLANGDIREMQRLLSGDGAEQRSEFFSFFVTLMRSSYNNKHLELVTWAEQVAQLTRSEQIGLLRYSIEMLREAYIRHAGVESLCYTWGEEAAFSRKFAPFINNSNIEFLIDETELAIAQLSQNANAGILFTHYALTVSKQINKLA